RRREEHRDETVGKADQESRNDRSSKRAKATNDHHDEGQQQRVLTHQVVRLLYGHNENRRKGSQASTKREDAGIDLADRNRESLRHFTVYLRRTHDKANVGASKQEPGSN